MAGLVPVVFLRSYQNMQLSIAYDRLIDLGFAMLSYAEHDDDIYWNFAHPNTGLTHAQIAEIELQFQALGRKPTFYYHNHLSQDVLTDTLFATGYQKSFEDMWMFWNNESVDTKRFNMVRSVETDDELQIFLDTMDSCYLADDPLNPYGVLGPYLDAARGAWQRNHGSGKLRYFMMYDGERPVSVAALTVQDGIGYISNVGSLPEVRGQGYGKAITLFCVDQSMRHGNIYHCLATEAGHYPYDFYTKLGFIKQFSAVGYTKYFDQ